MTPRQVVALIVVCAAVAALVTGPGAVWTALSEFVRVTWLGLANLIEELIL